jgi:hypothetical protein
MATALTFNGKSFIDYIRQMLVPTLSPGDIVIMDMCGHRVIADGAKFADSAEIQAFAWWFSHGRLFTNYVGLNVSQKLTAICIVDDTGRRLWRGQCPSEAERIERIVRQHGGDALRIGIETGPITP